MRVCGFNSVELRDTRYHQIIHMVSSAIGAEAFYTVGDHPCRSEDVDLAKLLDEAAAQAWVGHPYFDVIDNSTDFDTKIRRMINVVCQKMGIDTGDRLETNARKLKFLVKGPLPTDSVFPPFEDFDVEHIYLRTNTRKMQARLRKRGKNNHNSYTHTTRKPEQLGQIVKLRRRLAKEIGIICKCREMNTTSPSTKRGAVSSTTTNTSIGHLSETLPFTLQRSHPAGDLLHPELGGAAEATSFLPQHRGQRHGKTRLFNVQPESERRMEGL
ncbi:UNVERIFIED_CONTAM: hypothetical protein GTU68_016703 [Idotea baltica]|nr:hypothetical protein [Idotea baltica]